MDLELVTDGVVAEENPFVPDDADNDYPTLEGERCGICMDVVVDRGVLDCCQHWFCFACIDNWASITNLCPLCQSEFQLITCVPVFDTVGSSLDEDLYPRDDDWCVEGKNNTLSFPSYYIDENSATLTNGSYLESCIDPHRILMDHVPVFYSTAKKENCQLCTLQYKTGPLPSHEKLFICPFNPDRMAVVCLEGDDCKIRSGSANIAEDSNLDTSIACDSCDIWYHAFCVGFDPDGSSEDSWLCPRCLVASTPRKSDEHDLENAASECLVEAGFYRKVSVSVADAGETAVVVSMVEGNQQNDVPSENKLSNFEVSRDLKKDIGGNQGNKESTKKLLSELDIIKQREIDVSGSISDANGCDMEKEMNVNTEVRKFDGEPDVSDMSKTSSGNFFIEHVKNEPVEFDCSLQHDSSMASSSSAVDNVNHLAEDHVVRKMQEKSSFEECGLQADKTQRDKECPNGLVGVKRKQRDYRTTEDRKSKGKMEQHNVSAKKIKADRSSRGIHVKGQIDNLGSDDSRISSSLVVGPHDSNLVSRSRKDHATANIREIVQGTSRRKSSKDGENAAGLRVKKIMRRSNDDNESAMVVQNLRKEIRDAIRNKSSKDVGNNVLDPKLLDAFRAVVAGTSTENRRPRPLDLKANKLLLQKGKIRENLTKKIYGIGGRRKQNWTRDCEIEFWKHRCLKISKPEKIETLKSVLNLLRKSPEISETKQENDTGPTSSILSRLFLADASVFPRKDDIKPLLDLKDSGTLEQNKGPRFVEKACTSSPANPSFPVGVRVLQSIKGKSVSTKVHANKNPERSSKYTSGGSTSKTQNGTVVKKDLGKIDKRKWALEVLARKRAVLGKNAGAVEGDNAVLKGNFPLLAQLPADMRPVLAPSSHNKIPLSIRQTQLHRLTEHFLRKTNQPVTRRTAEIELAVVDAVNVEKEVANRSSSKLVYLNLCSQALSRKPDKITSSISPDSTPNLTSPIPNDQLQVATNKSSSLEVDEALINAGLLSDSPPSSPYNKMEDANDQSENITEEGPDNVFEIDAQPELDIYGDFEYDLEDEDFIGASALKISKVEQEESKIKVVFSTLDSTRVNGAWNLEEHEVPASVGLSNADNMTDKCLVQNSTLDEGGEEPLLEECEELYGPDKEPLISKFPESVSLRPFELLSNNIVPEANEGQRLNLAEKEPEVCSESCSENLVTNSVHNNALGKEDSFNQPEQSESKEKKTHDDLKNHSDRRSSIFKKVESYIKEHIRPLCKSGVITVEQYRWAVGKTTEKIMKYHSKDTNANFLIREGEKVKKLAEQYIETAQKVEKTK